MPLFRTFLNSLSSKKRVDSNVEPGTVRRENRSFPRKAETPQEELHRLRVAYHHESEKIITFRKFGMNEMIRTTEETLRAIDRRMKALDDRFSVAA